MPQTADDQYQEITKELYSKNVDLVNANKTFELIQKLYEIMITSFSVESVSQRFIDVITQTLGFTDGVVVIRYDKNEHLHVVGVTQTQINKTLLELAATPTVQVNFSLQLTENALVNVYKSGQSQSLNNIAQIWTPYIKINDLAGINSMIGQQLVLVYPIIYGEKVLGSFALVLGNAIKELTEFEKKALERLMTVFGIAIDRVRINIELRETEKRELDKTKQLLKLKDEFVFIATHDLKTPVTAINGFMELIEDSKQEFSQENKESLKAIKESSDRLKQLTNDLLQVARSDSGTIEVSVIKVDLVELIQKSVAQVTNQATEKNVSINLKLDLNNRFVMADEARLHEVVENLLSNAVKYNKQSGRVEVTSSLVNGVIKVDVTDTGFGIPVSAQAKVFEKFFRAHQKGTEGVAGTGLGLFVVRMLVEKMGGRITFTSTEGVGTTFTFYLKQAIS